MGRVKAYTSLRKTKMAESAFSSIKRTFGEHVSSVKWNSIVNELMLKASIYNLFMDKMMIWCNTSLIGYVQISYSTEHNPLILWEHQLISFFLTTCLLLFWSNRLNNWWCNSFDWNYWGKMDLEYPSAAYHWDVSLQTVCISASRLILEDVKIMSL